jgi:hypothetical protein
LPGEVAAQSGPQFIETDRCMNRSPVQSVEVFSRVMQGAVQAFKVRSGHQYHPSLVFGDFPRGVIDITDVEKVARRFRTSKWTDNQNVERLCTARYGTFKVEIEADCCIPKHNPTHLALVPWCGRVFFQLQLSIGFNFIRRYPQASGNLVERLSVRFVYFPPLDTGDGFRR